MDNTVEQDQHISPALSAGLFDTGAIQMHDEPPPPPPDVEAAERDISGYAHEMTQTDDHVGKEMVSENQRLLHLIRQRIGKKQVNASQLSFAP